MSRNMISFGFPRKNAGVSSCGRTVHWRRSAPLHPEDLFPYPILIPGRSLVQNELDNWFGDAYGALHIIGRYNLIYNAAILVEAGVGIALCLEKLVPVSEETELCFRPLAPALETGVLIAWKKNQIFPPAVAKFIELLKNAFRA